MANYKLVDADQLDADLKTVADAIREKGGTTDQLAFPDGMASAVEAIQAGGDEPAPPADGKTRIYIHLDEGRTSPVLGVCPNGTVTVDWGDGTTPDTLTGTSTSSVKWTPTHNYAEAGDYVITLAVDGEMGFYGYSNIDNASGLIRYSSYSDKRNAKYADAIRVIVIGEGVKKIAKHSFYTCRRLEKAILPKALSSIENSAFDSCYNLKSCTIPDGVTSIDAYAFSSCNKLESMEFPDSVSSIGGAVFSSTSGLKKVKLPSGLVSLSQSSFSDCRSLENVVLPDGLTSIGNSAFSTCCGLTKVTIPKGVSSIGSSAFYNCYGMRCYDFSACTSVPTLSNTSAFNNIPADCEMLIPSALFDEWSAATNWTTYASYMRAV